MSRENAKSGTRCPNCGGRMRLVNVTWINKFQTPEASQYDLSVSRRQKKAESSAQQLMCTCCAQRTPITVGKAEKRAKIKNGKVKKVAAKKESKKAKRAKKTGVVRFIKFLIFLAIVAAAVYFAYSYKDTLLGLWAPLADVFQKIDELIAFVQGFFNK